MKCSKCNGDFPEAEFMRKNGTNGSGKPVIKRGSLCRECAFDQRSSIHRVVKHYNIEPAFKVWASGRRP